MTRPAVLRLAFDELFAHKLALQLVRARLRQNWGRPTLAMDGIAPPSAPALPFAPTGAQNAPFAEIDRDMARRSACCGLLQGDVGAGKTLVAVLAMAAFCRGRPAIRPDGPDGKSSHGNISTGSRRWPRPLASKAVLLTGRMKQPSVARA